MKQLALAAMLAIAGGCGVQDGELDCDDLLPAAQTSYHELALIITDTNDPRNCAQCHTGSEPIYGINLETPQSAYFTLRDRIDHIYPMVSTGEMPKEGLAWGAADLQLLRSWWCRGAFYD